MENAAFGTLCRLGRARPGFIPALNRLTSAALSARSYTDVSHRVFVTPRRVRFVESEYAVPRESLGQVIAGLRREVPRLAEPVMVPVEVRVAAADDPASGYGRSSDSERRVPAAEASAAAGDREEYYDDLRAQSHALGRSPEIKASGNQRAGGR